MNSDELIAAVRTSGQIPSADATYTSAQIRTELYNALTTFFEAPIVNSREGYWLKQYVVTCTPGLAVYRLPHRSITNSAERVEISTDGVRYHQLNKLGVRDASQYEGATGNPCAYTMRGDSVQLFPTPSAGCRLRVHYYLRPSVLVAPQSAANKGLIATVGTNSLVLGALPDDMVVTPNVAIASGSRVDVVRPNGSHEVIVVSAVATISTLTLTFDSTVDLSMVAVGDYVRAEDQSEWPALPKDFHRTLADCTAMLILVSKGYQAKAQVLSAKVKADLDRFTDLIQPRVMDSPRVVKPRFGILRSRGRRV